MNEEPMLPFVGIRTFMRSPYQADLTDISTDIAVLGAPFDLGTAVRPGSRFGPAALREASLMYGPPAGFYDPDEDQMFLSPDDVRMVDLGDAPMLHFDANYCINSIREMVRRSAESGAFVLTLGGDHSVHAPCIEGVAAAGRQNIHIVHLDAHLDYVDSVEGVVRYGQGNPLRRAADLEAVAGITHIGIRGIGSSKRSDFQAARENKSRIVTMQEFRKIGVEAALEHIPNDAEIYFTIDIDGFDAGLAPGTGTPSFGGLSYDDGMSIVGRVASKRICIGMDFVELAPAYDLSGASALFGAQFIAFGLCQIFRPGRPTYDRRLSANQ